MFAKSALVVVSVSAVSNEEWEAWKQEHGRVYDGADEDVHRRSVFESNLATAAEQQKLNPEAEFGATQFSDWTPEEFKERLLNYVPSNITLPEFDLSDLPLEVAASQDWTGTATTSVKNQGSCGSCWAFSAVEQIESDLMRQHGTKITLAPQELVDCTGSGGRRNGCNGGDPAAAYKVVEQLGGIERESSYSYTARNGNCRFSRSSVAARVSSYQSVGRGSESSMKSYVGSSGPLSVCVDANSWHNYRSGVMTSCGNSVDHCVQIVGYGDYSSGSYWKVRNSWGTSFGESGHLRIKIGNNLCRINSEPTKVTVSASAADIAWEAWKQDNGRVFNGADEDAYRRSVFESNLATAAEQQKLNPEAEFGATQFSDWTPEEFKQRLLNYVPSNITLPEFDLSDLPLEVAASQDWTGTATTLVKNQGSCGSCWAFSAVEQIESDLMRQHGTKITLAPQELVDCTGSGGRRNGCNGGDPAAAYKVVEQLGGIERESSYSYTARNGNCRFSRSSVAARVSSYQSVGRGSESSMKSYVGSSGPLSVCVDANSWHNYRSGVMTSCGNSVDHCVQIVGYGDYSSGSYWKVRNSWGTSFGESGHLRIKIGNNLCRINSEPTKVTVSASANEVQV